MATTIFAGTALLLAVLERFPRLRMRAQSLLRPYFFSDVVYLLTGFVAGTSLALAYVAAGSDWLGSRAGLPRLAGLEPPRWLAVPLALVAIDAGNYFAHWLLHRFDVLWEVHKVHHSSRQLDWLAAFRSHLLEQLLRRAVAPLLLIAIGFPIEAVALAGGVFTAWAALNHSNLRFGPPWLERFVVTPRLHRIHHRSESSESNLGTVLTLWDRLRGTLLTEPPPGAERLGVPGEVESYPQGWWRQLARPFVRVGDAARSRQESGCADARDAMASSQVRSSEAC